MKWRYLMEVCFTFTRVYSFNSLKMEVHFSKIIDWLIDSNKLIDKSNENNVEDQIVQAIQLSPSVANVNILSTYFDCKNLITHFEQIEGSKCKNLFGVYLLPYLENWNNILVSWRIGNRHIVHASKKLNMICLFELPSKKKEVTYISKQYQEILLRLNDCEKNITISNRDYIDACSEWDISPITESIEDQLRKKAHLVLTQCYNEIEIVLNSEEFKNIYLCLEKFQSNAVSQVIKCGLEQSGPSGDGSGVKEDSSTSSTSTIDIISNMLCPQHVHKLTPRKRQSSLSSMSISVSAASSDSEDGNGEWTRLSTPNVLSSVAVDHCRTETGEGHGLGLEGGGELRLSMSDDNLVIVSHMEHPAGIPSGSKDQAETGGANIHRLHGVRERCVSRLLEMQGFLTCRHQELATPSSMMMMTSAFDATKSESTTNDLHSMSHNDIREALLLVDLLVDKLTNTKHSKYISVAENPLYLQRVTQSIATHLNRKNQIEKIRSDLQRRGGEVQDRITKITKELNELTNYAINLKKDLELEISATAFNNKIECKIVGDNLT